MSRPDETPWTKYRPRKVPDYVITPGFLTEEELVAAVNRVRAAYPDRNRVPQCDFLKILGYTGHTSVRDVKNDVLMDTFEIHKVENSDMRYWYGRFDVMYTTRFVSDKYHLGASMTNNDYAC